MELETDTMLRNGIIRFSSSDWAAVPVFAKKKDGGIRYAIDLRPLNDCLMMDRLGMGNMDDIINSLGECKARPVQHIRHIGRVRWAVGEGM